ncbi:MAG: twin-arginine translocation signal domain-containing protein [Acidobacteriota bacterium]
MSEIDSKKDPSTQDLSDAETGGLDRRGFLKISSAVAATAAVAGTALADRAPRPEKNQPKSRPAGAAKDLKGGWFVV